MTVRFAVTTLLMNETVESSNSVLRLDRVDALSFLLLTSITVTNMFVHVRCCSLDDHQTIEANTLTLVRTYCSSL